MEKHVSTLQWSEDFALGVGAMDQTHIEFVDLLAEVQQAPDDTLLAKWEELIDHTQVHFDNENRWMVETRFAAGNCHTTHHKAVLDVMRDGLHRPPRAVARRADPWLRRRNLFRRKRACRRHGPHSCQRLTRRRLPARLLCP